MPTQGNPVSAAGYWIGAAILVLGCGGALVWFVVVIVGLVQAPDDFDRFTVPGSTVVTLDDGDWMIYHEYAGADSGSYLQQPAIDVTGPNGRPVSLFAVGTSYTYSTGSYDGVGIYEFDAPTAGAYTIEASTFGEPSRFSTQSIAVGRPLFDAANVGGLLGSIALGAVSFIVGLVILIVTIVRRGRGRRRQPPAMMPYGSAPPYGQPGYGAAGYGPPPYGQPGYGPPQPAAYPPQPGAYPPQPGAYPPAAPPASQPGPWTPPGTPPGDGEPGPGDRPPS
jgi:hypothetical protein